MLPCVCMYQSNGPCISVGSHLRLYVEVQTQHEVPGEIGQQIHAGAITAIPIKMCVSILTAPLLGTLTTNFTKHFACRVSHLWGHHAG
jgi:hypothetical protein